ncbi:GNAT family N-acetyltransferase [Embleya sp. NPDC050154]|uniref:GNAT family N-acetyltransferase n=1 Tax=unclassified Embleya TaxID=2699296 RepID=UPI003788A7B6
MTTTLRLEKITPANFDDAVALRVRPDQAHLVAPVVKSLAQAYVHPDTAWPRLILDGDRPVGFLMAFFDIDMAFFDDDPTEAGAARDEDGGGKVADLRSGLWRLNIAAGEQRRGYGRFAVASVADEIRRRGGTRLTTSWHPGDDGPEGFYLRLGFRPTGENSGDERIGELDLS